MVTNPDGSPLRNLKPLEQLLAQAALSAGIAALLNKEVAAALYLVSQGADNIDRARFDMCYINLFDAQSGFTARLERKSDYDPDSREDGSLWRAYTIWYQVTISGYDGKGSTLNKRLPFYSAVAAIAEAMDAVTAEKVTVLVRTAEEEAEKKKLEAAQVLKNQIDCELRAAVDLVRGGMRLGGTKSVPIALLANVPQGHHTVVFSDYNGKITKRYTVWVDRSQSRAFHSAVLTRATLLTTADTPAALSVKGLPPRIE